MENTLYAAPDHTLSNDKPHAVSLHRWRAPLIIGLVVLDLIAFIALMLAARTTPYFPFDLAITRVVQFFTAPWFDTLMRLTSWMGIRPQVFIWIIVVIFALYLSGYRWEAAGTFIAAGGIGALGGIVKLFIDRPRPSGEIVHVFRVLDGMTDSFPAGHVMGNVAIMGFLIYVALTVFKPSWYRALLVLFLASQIALIGLSRIYEGEHWFSDVVGAYLLGAFWLVITVCVYRWGKPRFWRRNSERGMESGSL